MTKQSKKLLNTRHRTKREKEAIDTRNDADSMVFQTEKALEDSREIRLTPTTRPAVEADLNALKSLIENSNPEEMTDAQVAEIKAAKEKLMQSAQKTVREGLRAGTGSCWRSAERS